MDTPTSELPATVPISELQDLLVKAELGKVLGRNIERAAAGWALMYSAVLLLSGPVDPVYKYMLQIGPLSVWAWLIGVLSMARVVTLIVNGWWPVTLQVRIALCVATLMIVWGVLTASLWLDMGLHWGQEGSRVLPGVALAPFAATVEALCFLALRTRLEVAKGVAPQNDRASNYRDSWWSSELVARVRECLGETDNPRSGPASR